MYALSRNVGEPAVSVDFNTAISESVSAGSTAAMKDGTAPPPASTVGISKLLRKRRSEKAAAGDKHH